ncbi:MAG: alpha-galactosidase [Propionicimonas sp.]
MPQRHPLTSGRYTRESRKGRSGADGSLLLIAGETGFGFDRGEVRSVHVAWSGNQSMSAERSVLNGAVLAAGELLLPGEVILQAGESYSSPWIYAAWGDGLDDMAARFHAELRADRPHGGPRAALLNVWEAVYFDHQVEPLKRLADRAAEAGLELYVLDDGWFLGRRDDRRALGDWFVDPDVWPDGLTPLIEHVCARGLRFGIWVEPEMVSVDSRLAREHPEWILRPGRRLPPVAKWQHVLNVAHPEVFDYLHERLDWLLANHDISYLKWDHNRDVLEPGDAEGRARLHDHVTAVYRLIDTLRTKHPAVEFENCASGGSRIDLELLARTHRTWVSDCTDPLERARIQQYTGLLLPLEMMGNDIAAARSHLTGRNSQLDLRGTVALLGWLGVQWDLNRVPDEDRALLRGWVELYRQVRQLLHSGRALTLTSPDPSVLLRAVVSKDQQEALITVVQLTSSFAPSAGRLRLPGLLADELYDVRVVTPGVQAPRSMAYSPSNWVKDGTRLSGRMLAQAGLELPLLDPEQGMVIAVTRPGSER